MSKIFLCDDKTGKTKFAEKYNLKEFDKSLFTKSEEEVSNFFKCTEILIGTTEAEVIDELKLRRIKYSLVFPEVSLRREYIRRHLEGKKNSSKYASQVERTWNQHLLKLYEDRSHQIVLKTEGCFISNSLYVKKLITKNAKIAYNVINFNKEKVKPFQSLSDEEKLYYEKIVVKTFF